MEFLSQTILVKSDIIGLPGLLTGSFDAVLETIHLIRISRENGISSLPIIIGGSQLNEQVCWF